MDMVKIMQVALITSDSSKMTCLMEQEPSSLNNNVSMDNSKLECYKEEVVNGKVELLLKVLTIKVKENKAIFMEMNVHIVEDSNKIFTMDQGLSCSKIT